MSPERIHEKYRPKPTVPYSRLADDFRALVNSLDHSQSRRLIHEVADEMRELIVQVRESVGKYSSDVTFTGAYFALIRFGNPSAGVKSFLDVTNLILLDKRSDVSTGMKKWT
jgi:hypothetical protein